MHRRNLNLLAGLALAAASASGITRAQTDWPARTVTIVVPYAAGGNTDIMARMASQKLTEAFKQSFIVDNRVGAGGALAANYVAKAAPDGYTLFFAAAPLTAVLSKVQKVNYDPHGDFIPVSIFGTGPFILAISSAIAARNIPEFVAYARSSKINYGSGGTGSVGHLAGALFVARGGIDAVPADRALLAGTRRRGRKEARRSVAAQIGHDDPAPRRRERRHHFVEGARIVRKAVHQQHRDAARRPRFLVGNLQDFCAHPLDRRH
jgi:hypothetical protein